MLSGRHTHDTHSRTHAQKHTHTHSHTHLYTHTHNHIQTHAHIHTHIHTHTHTHKASEILIRITMNYEDEFGKNHHICNIKFCNPLP